MSGVLVVQQADRGRIFGEAMAAGSALAELTGLPLQTVAVGGQRSYWDIVGPEAAYVVQHPLLEIIPPMATFWHLSN